MDRNLESAVTKMGMSSSPYELRASIDFLLKHSPYELEYVTDDFNLSDEEKEAFNSYVESIKNKSNFNENRMRSKIIRLTESNIERLVKKIIKEDINNNRLYTDLKNIINGSIESNDQKIEILKMIVDEMSSGREFKKNMISRWSKENERAKKNNGLDPRNEF